jgi:hypothetical protein
LHRTATRHRVEAGARSGGGGTLERISRPIVQVALVGGPVAIGFASGGFGDSPRSVAAIAAWALVAFAALTWTPAPIPRTAAVGGLLLLAGWVALSALWAPLVDPARDDLVRILLYAAVLLLSASAWRSRTEARLLEPAVALGTLVVVGYGVAGRLLPGVFVLERSPRAAGRLDQPLTYWNAMGALAAIGLVLCARVAGDRERRPALRVAAAAAAAPLGMGLYLSFSRGALGALAMGVLVLIALAPERAQLSSVALALAGGALAALAASLSPSVQSLAGDAAARRGQGAAVLAALVAVAAAVGLAQWLVTRREGPGVGFGRPWTRRIRAGAVAGIVAVAVVSLALGSTSQAPPPAPGSGAARFGEAGSNRHDYWAVAARAFADHPLIGVGSGGFRVEWLRERSIDEFVVDAHSLYLETAAELGLVGLAALALLIAGLATAVRRLYRSDAALAVGPAAVLAAYALHAGVDWDWEMPALTLPVLVIGGMALSRVALSEPRAG